MQYLGLILCHHEDRMTSAVAIIQLLPLISMVYVGSFLLSFLALHCSLVSCLIARSFAPLWAFHMSRHTDTNMAWERGLWGDGKKTGNLFLACGFLSLEPQGGLNSLAEGGPGHILHALWAIHSGNKTKHCREMSLNHTIVLERTRDFPLRSIFLPFQASK